MSGDGVGGWIKGILCDTFEVACSKPVAPAPTATPTSAPEKSPINSADSVADMLGGGSGKAVDALRNTNKRREKEFGI